MRRSAPGRVRFDSGRRWRRGSLVRAPRAGPPHRSSAGNHLRRSASAVGVWPSLPATGEGRTCSREAVWLCTHARAPTNSLFSRFGTVPAAILLSSLCRRPSGAPLRHRARRAAPSAGSERPGGFPTGRGGWGLGIEGGRASGGPAAAACLYLLPASNEAPMQKEFSRRRASTIQTHVWVESALFLFFL